MPLLNLDQAYNNIHFVTGNTYRRINLFQYNPIFAKFFIDNLNFYSQKYQLNFLAYILMPEHYHFEDDPKKKVKLSKVLQSIKGYTARRIIDFIKTNPEQKFTVAYLQKIIPAKEFQEIKNLIPSSYKIFTHAREKNSELVHHQKLAYFLDLSLLVSETNLTLPIIIKKRNLEDKIVQIKNYKGKRDIILRVNGSDLLKLLQTYRQRKRTRDSFYKVFQEQDFKEIIEGNEAVNNSLKYIYENATKRGLCKKPEDYPYLGGLLIK